MSHAYIPLYNKLWNFSIKKTENPVKPNDLTGLSAVYPIEDV
jgi:hypothetical protein